MSTNPIPIIMVSSLTTSGSEESIKALELGAVDFVSKPSSFISLKITDITEELLEKIRAASKANISFEKNTLRNLNTPNLRFIRDRIKSRAEKIASDINIKNYKSLISTESENTEYNLKIDSEFRPELIVIGVSTGGPASLHKIMEKLPDNLPCSIIIAQHMPKGFTESLAKRLNLNSKLEIKEAEEGDVLKPGRVFIAPSGYQTTIRKRFIGHYLHISEEKGDLLYKPSIDHIFTSAAETYKNKVLGIVMTGMGSDGAKGAEKIYEAGGKVFAQSLETCVVSSMPSAIINKGIASNIYPLNLIALAIENLYTL